MSSTYENKSNSNHVHFLHDSHIINQKIKVKQKRIQKRRQTLVPVTNVEAVPWNSDGDDVANVVVKLEDGDIVIDGGEGEGGLGPT